MTRLRALLTLHRTPPQVRVLHALAAGHQSVPAVADRYQLSLNATLAALSSLMDASQVERFTLLSLPPRLAYRLTPLGRVRATLIQGAAALDEALEVLAR